MAGFEAPSEVEGEMPLDASSETSYGATDDASTGGEAQTGTMIQWCSCEVFNNHFGRWLRYLRILKAHACLACLLFVCFACFIKYHEAAAMGPKMLGGLQLDG